MDDEMKSNNKVERHNGNKAMKSKNKFKKWKTRNICLSVIILWPQCREFETIT